MLLNIKVIYFLTFYSFEKGAGDIRKVFGLHVRA